MERAVETLFPSPKPGNEWSVRRCLAVWGAWTLGLVDGTNGHWERAVAAYQAGLGLAPGRVPPDIVQEYYWTLAQYILGGDTVSPAQQLAAAKYLALAGEGDAAGELFESLRQDKALTPEQRCEAEQGLAWLQAGGDRMATLPAWPVTYLGNGVCKQQAGPLPSLDTGWSPEWMLTQANSAVDDALDRTLLGFDLDHDVLEAGAEVIGVLYWQTPAGQLEAQRFREPNLWPNSGNSWLPFEGFSTCLPGYGEPPWVAPCASRVFYPHSDEVGRIQSAFCIMHQGDMETPIWAQRALLFLGG